MAQLEGFLGSLRKQKEIVNFVIRPPYSKKSSLFELCLECQEKPCINACEQNILAIDQNGAPFVIWNNKGCTFCEDCSKACEKNVLEKTDLNSFINATFQIDTKKCLAWNLTICSSCKDACFFKGSIEFFGMYRPIITEKCVSCGWCLKTCPIEDAIIIKAKELL